MFPTFFKFGGIIKKNYRCINCGDVIQQKYFSIDYSKVELRVWCRVSINTFETRFVGSYYYNRGTFVNYVFEDILRKTNKLTKHDYVPALYFITKQITRVEKEGDVSYLDNTYYEVPEVPYSNCLTSYFETDYPLSDVIKELEEDNDELDDGFEYNSIGFILVILDTCVHDDCVWFNKNLNTDSKYFS